MEITTIVSQQYAVDPSELSKWNKKRRVVEPRQVCMFFCYMFLSMSGKATANQYGLVNHTTTIHSAKTVSSLYKSNRTFRERLDAISDLLGITHDELKTLLKCQKQNL